LQDFQGALVVVSHDRLLLSACCDEFLLVADGQARAFEGDLDDYAQWLRDWRAAQEQKKEAKPVKPVPAPKVEAAPVAAPVKKTGTARDQQKALAKLENQLAAVQDRLSELDGLLSDTGLYESARKDELERLLAEKRQQDGELAVLEEKWLALSDATSP
jgi:ATP-binding cassette subfamily F protein 3